MTNAELQAFIQAEVKKSLLRRMLQPLEESRLRATMIYGTPRFDNEGNVLSVDHSTETALIDPALRNNAHLAPKESEELTLQNIKAAYELLKPYQENAITSQQPQKSCTIWTQSAGPSRCAYRFAARFATIHGFGRRLFSTAVKRPRRGASA